MEHWNRKHRIEEMRQRIRHCNLKHCKNALSTAICTTVLQYCTSIVKNSEEIEFSETAAATSSVNFFQSDHFRSSRFFFSCHKKINRPRFLQHGRKFFLVVVVAVAKKSHHRFWRRLTLVMRRIDDADAWALEVKGLNEVLEFISLIYSCPLHYCSLFCPLKLHFNKWTKGQICHAVMVPWRSQEFSSWCCWDLLTALLLTVDKCLIMSIEPI